MQPLEGLRVIDLTHAGAGPYGTMLLADMGADVIKIEPKEGDLFRKIYDGAFLVYNRNKRSLTLNLKTEEGKEILRKLIRKADVFVESFRPGTLEKMGFSFENLVKINPKIIYCSLSGFGSTGPYAGRRAFDPIIQAMCGSMASTGEPDRPPVRNSGSFIDFGTGTLMAYGILAALILREKTGKPQKVDVSLFDTAVSWMGYWLTYYVLSGNLPEKFGTGWRAYVPYKLFKTKDRPIYIGVYDEEAWKNFCDVLGLENVKNNPKFSTNESRVKHRDELEKIIENRLMEMSCEEVENKLVKVGVPCGPLLTVADLLKNPQLLARNMIIKLKHPEKGFKVEATGIPLKIFGVEEKIRYQPPSKGEHTKEILKELGYKEEEIFELKKKNIV